MHCGHLILRWLHSFSSIVLFYQFHYSLIIVLSFMMDRSNENRYNQLQPVGIFLANILVPANVIPSETRYNNAVIPFI